MIDIERAKEVFEKYTEMHKSEEDIEGFLLKKNHTYHVMQMSRFLAEKLNLSEEDIELAELIGLLHDIGRFEELAMLKSFNNLSFDHAAHGVKVLFEDNWIREFLADEKYDLIIKKAIYNHNKLKIEDGLDERALLHSKIIRDSDKLDNFRVKIEYKPNRIFHNDINSRAEFENSEISENVYNSMCNRECVKTSDRKLPLDYYVVILGFMYDLYYRESYRIIKEKDYINRLIDKFEYRKAEAKARMEKIRLTLTEYVEIKLADELLGEN
ncbi:MAG: HD domain-containing protein [Clostridia bacterium]|nr:HD domain-containing protein [Clostridia bacterium]